MIRFFDFVEKITFGVHIVHLMLIFTGLDPAKPWFDLAGADARILITDADLVDIIHTNSGNMWDVSSKHFLAHFWFLLPNALNISLQGALSFPEALGHVDFYPNGKPEIRSRKIEDLLNLNHYFSSGGEHQAGCVAPCSFACGLDDLIDMVHCKFRFFLISNIFAETLVFAVK